jgi:hypothetical protein
LCCSHNLQGEINFYSRFWHSALVKSRKSTYAKDKNRQRIKQDAAGLHPKANALFTSLQLCKRGIEGDLYLNRKNTVVRSQDIRLAMIETERRFDLFCWNLPL